MPKKWIWVMGVFMVFWGTGCDRGPKTPAPEYIIKAGPILVTKAQFSEELDLKLSAYPYDIKNDPDRYNEVVMDLVSTLYEETLLLAVAQKMQITVTDQAADAMENHIKSSYPEDSFDQMLLENAVPYMVWKKKLQNTMVIDKLLQQQLLDKIDISPDDVKHFFEKHQAEESTGPGLTGFKDGTQLVEQLRRKKGEMHYQEWIQSLKQDMDLDINKHQLAQLLIGNEKKGMTYD
jgi:hypothetical protein